MWGFIIIGVLAAVSLAALVRGGDHPRERDRGGFEHQPGSGGGYSGGPLG